MGVGLSEDLGLKRVQIKVCFFCFFLYFFLGGGAWAVGVEEIFNPHGGSILVLVPLEYSLDLTKQGLPVDFQDFQGSRKSAWCMLLWFR